MRLRTRLEATQCGQDQQDAEVAKQRWLHRGNLCNNQDTKIRLRRDGFIYTLANVGQDNGKYLPKTWAKYCN